MALDLNRVAHLKVPALYHQAEQNVFMINSCETKTFQCVGKGIPFCVYFYFFFPPNAFLGRSAKREMMQTCKYLLMYLFRSTFAGIFLFRRAQWHALSLPPFPQATLRPNELLCNLIQLSQRLLSAYLGPGARLQPEGIRDAETRRAQKGSTLPKGKLKAEPGPNSVYGEEGRAGGNAGSAAVETHRPGIRAATMQESGRCMNAQA